MGCCVREVMDRRWKELAGWCGDSGGYVKMERSQGAGLRMVVLEKSTG